MPIELSDKQVNDVLQRFDDTEPALQRKIFATSMLNLTDLKMQHEELARAVLEMLRTQKEYFSTKDVGTLTRSKTLEGAMKRRCERILTPDESLSLFEG